jgi:Protein of unknown function (DUF4238)
MPRPKRHHYVPEWYLKGFPDPQSGCLHAYDKTTKKYSTPKPKNIMVIRDYHKQAHVPDGVDPDIFEKGLGSWIESTVKNSFLKLVNDPTTLTNEDNSNIITYLDLQHNRVPRQIDLARRAVKKGVFPELASEESLLAFPDHFRFHYIKMFWGAFAEFFSRMNWEVVTAPATCSFITTDSPVSFYNPAFPPPIEAGIGFVGTIVLFPIDSRHSLVLWHPEYVRGTPSRAVERISSSEVKPRDFDLFYGRVETEEQVYWHNYIMYHLSDRFIVGRSKHMLEKAMNPDFLAYC